MARRYAKKQLGDTPPGRLARRSQITDNVINAIERRVRARRHGLPTTAGEITARLSEIQTAALPIEQRYRDNQWLPRSDASFLYWTFFEASNYPTLPFARGLADQLEWLLTDFLIFIELTDGNTDKANTRFGELKVRGRLPALPRIEDVLHRQCEPRQHSAAIEYVIHPQ